MKRFFFGLSAAAMMAALTAPAFACQGEHGYKKTTQALQQSPMPAAQKAELTERLQKSEAAHDKYTLSGEYGKMNEAVLEVSAITRQIRN